MLRERNHRARVLILTAMAAALAACTSRTHTRPGDDEDGSVPITMPDGGGGDATAAADTGTPASDGGVAQGPPAPPPAKGLAVVATTLEFSATTIAILDATGALVHNDCIHSEAGPGASLTLSGDVTLPSQPQRGNELWLIDRGNAALAVLDPAACVIRRQLSVKVSPEFRANPHDLVVLSDSKAYVTRFEKNLVATTPNAIGDDIVILNPMSGTVAGRIDLGPYAATLEGVTIQARPDRAVLAKGKVFVTLGDQDAHFVASEARLVVIDPAVDRVTSSVALTGLKSCSAMHVLGDTLFVACSGAFGDVDQALQSGVAIIDLGVDPPALTKVISSLVFKARPINFSWVTAASPTQVFAGTLGAFPDSTSGAPAVADAVFQLDSTTGLTTQLRLAGAAYDLGRGAGVGERVFVPDANAVAPLVHVFRVPAGAAPTEAGTLDPAHGLAPREVAGY